MLKLVLFPLFATLSISVVATPASTTAAPATTTTTTASTPTATPGFVGGSCAVNDDCNYGLLCVKDTCIRVTNPLCLPSEANPAPPPGEVGGFCSSDKEDLTPCKPGLVCFVNICHKTSPKYGLCGTHLREPKVCEKGFKCVFYNFEGPIVGYCEK